MQHKLATRHELPLKNAVKLQDKEDWLTLAPVSKSLSTWLPINPARTSTGAWVSLAKLVGEDKAHPVPFDTPNGPLTSFSVVATQVDISVAAKLGLGPIFTGTLNWNDQAFYLDATAYTDRYSETTGNFVYATRWGIGLRVLLHVWDVKAGLSLNFGMVGAAAQLGFAKALYEIDGIGIGLDGMQIVLREMQTIGDFNADTYYKIQNVILPKLADYMRDNSTKLVPEPYQVQVIQPIDIDPLLGAKSIMFAMRRMRDGCSLSETLAKSAGKHDEQEIKIVYAKLAPGSGPNDHPPESAHDAAADWLKDN